MICIPTKGDKLRLEKQKAKILEILKEEAKEELKNRWISPARKNLLEDLLKKDKLIDLSRWQPSQNALRRLRQLELIEDSAIFPETEFPPFQRWLHHRLTKQLRNGSVLGITKSLPDFHAEVIEEIEPALMGFANVFYRSGDMWFVKFDGIWRTLHDRKRLRYIIYLLEKPNKPINPIELIWAVEKTNIEFEESYKKSIEADLSKGNLRLLSSSHMSITQEYREGIIEMASDYALKLKEAKEYGDTSKIAEAQNTWDKIKNHFSTEYNMKLFLGPNYEVLCKDFKRKERNTLLEKARQSVKKNITRAIQDIKKELPALGEHLSCIETGHSCNYSPHQSTYWHICW